MSSLENNKIFGALLGTGLFVMAAGIVSDMVFANHAPEKPGYELASLDPAAAAGGDASAEAAVPLPVLLASASAERGQSLVRACAACHAFEKGGPNKVGPGLYGVVGHEKAAHEGFSYSDALKSKGGAWSFEDLDHFIANPRGYAPGTKMAYAGEKNPARRADMLAYLRSLSDSPVDLPAVQAEAPPAEGAPAGGDSTPTTPGTAPAQPQQAPAQSQPPQ